MRPSSLFTRCTAFAVLTQWWTLVDGVLSPAGSCCYNATSAPDYLCPPDVPDVRLEHATSCSRYYACDRGKATLMSCPPGGGGPDGAGRQFFDPVSGTCGPSAGPCLANARVLVLNVTGCASPGTPGNRTRSCQQVFAANPVTGGSDSSVFVCNPDGSAFLVRCPRTATGEQTIFLRGRCRQRPENAQRGRYKWEKLLSLDYLPLPVQIRTKRTHTGIHALTSAEEHTRGPVLQGRKMGAPFQ